MRIERVPLSKGVRSAARARATHQSMVTRKPMQVPQAKASAGAAKPAHAMKPARMHPSQSKVPVAQRVAAQEAANAAQEKRIEAVRGMAGAAEHFKSRHSPPHVVNDGPYGRDFVVQMTTPPKTVTSNEGSFGRDLSMPISKGQKHLKMGPESPHGRDLG